MDVSRTKRVIGAIINGLTLDGLLIGNLILLLTAGKTIGGMVAGYKYEKSGVDIFTLWATNMLAGFLYGITFGIFWIVDVATMGGRNGTFAEKWADNRKEAL